MTGGDLIYARGVQAMLRPVEGGLLSAGVVGLSTTPDEVRLDMTSISGLYTHRISNMPGECQRGHGVWNLRITPGLQA